MSLTNFGCLSHSVAQEQTRAFAEEEALGWAEIEAWRAEEQRVAQRAAAQALKAANGIVGSFHMVAFPAPRALAVEAGEALDRAATFIALAPTQGLIDGLAGARAKFSARVVREASDSALVMRLNGILATAAAAVRGESLKTAQAAVSVARQAVEQAREIGGTGVRLAEVRAAWDTRRSMRKAG